jgi:hypothetical protein
MLELGPAIQALGLHKADLTGKKWVGRCGVHGGDNPAALVIWLDEPTTDLSQARTGRWACMTHHCGAEGPRLISNGRLLLPGEVDLDTLAALPPRSFEPPPEPQNIPGNYEEVLQAAFDLYRRHYPNSPGHRYLRGRAVDPPEAGYVIGHRFLLSRGLPREALVDLGLVWGETTLSGREVARWKVGTDRLAGRVILPYRWNGHLTCLYGRAVAPEESFHHLYTSCRTRDAEWRRGVYNETALERHHFMLVESAIDALAGMRRGGRIVRLAAEQNGFALDDAAVRRFLPLPVCGTGGTDNRVVVQRIPADARFLLGHDADEPGDLAAEEIRKQRPDQATRVRPPEGFKDWGAWNQALADRQHTGVRRPPVPSPDEGSHAGVA